MRNISTKVDNVGDELTAGEWNSDQDELENIITSTDQSLDSGSGPDTDLNMLGKAVALYSAAGQFYQDSGAANAYVLSRSTNLKAVPAYKDGMKVTFKASAVNTGASTINVSGLGVKSLTQYDGTALDAGQIRNNDFTDAIYNASNDRFEIVGLVDTQFAAGTSMVFDNSTAPVGWTRKTSYNDTSMFVYKASGVPSTGGSGDPTASHTHTGPSHTHSMQSHTHSMQGHVHSGPNHTHTTAGHALTTAEMPSHNHSYYVQNYYATGEYWWTVNLQNSSLATSSSGGSASAAPATTSSGSNAAHNHGSTGAGGTGNTGGPSSGSTGSPSNDTTTAAGSGNTGSNTAPYYIQMILATKD